MKKTITKFFMLVLFGVTAFSTYAGDCSFFVGKWESPHRPAHWIDKANGIENLQSMYETLEINASGQAVYTIESGPPQPSNSSRNAQVDCVNEGGNKYLISLVFSNGATSINSVQVSSDSRSMSGRYKSSYGYLGEVDFVRTTPNPAQQSIDMAGTCLRGKAEVTPDNSSSNRSSYRISVRNTCAYQISYRICNYDANGNSEGLGWQCGTATGPNAAGWMGANESRQLMPESWSNGMRFRIAECKAPLAVGNVPNANGGKVQCGKCPSPGLCN